MVTSNLLRRICISKYLLAFAESMITAFFNGQRRTRKTHGGEPDACVSRYCCNIFGARLWNLGTWHKPILRHRPKIFYPPAVKFCFVHMKITLTCRNSWTNASAKWVLFEQKRTPLVVHVNAARCICRKSGVMRCCWRGWKKSCFFHCIFASSFYCISVRLVSVLSRAHLHSQTTQSHTLQSVRASLQTPQGCSDAEK